MSYLNLYKHILGINPVGIINNFLLERYANSANALRQVPIKIYYPQASGLFPVIIFSHGSGGSKNAFSYLGRFWASHGYISIHPTHFGSDKSVFQSGGRDALENSSKDPQQWRDRAGDISFLIDSLKQLERNIPPLTQKIDYSHIGVSGHSYGAYTAILIAGALVDIPQQPNITFQDERACAFLGISSQGSGTYGLTKSSWNEIQAPVMTVSGTKETGGKGKPKSWRLEPFKYMPPGNKYHTLIQNAEHSSYNDYKRSTEISKLEMQAINDIHTYLQSASIAFWDAYLKEDNSAREYLKSKMLQIYSNGKASIFER